MDVALKALLRESAIYETPEKRKEFTDKQWAALPLALAKEASQRAANYVEFVEALEKTVTAAKAKEESDAREPNTLEETKPYCQLHSNSWGAFGAGGGNPLARRPTADVMALDGGGNGIAPDARFDQRYGEFRLPLQMPKLVEGAFLLSAIALEFAPFQAQKTEPMQEAAAVQIVGLAQIQIEGAHGGFGRQAQALLLASQVLGQRRHRRFAGNFAQTLADNQFVANEPQRQRFAVNKNGLGRFIEFRQARQRPMPQGSERLRQAHGFDHTRRRSVQVLFAEEPGDTRQPGGGQGCVAVAAPACGVPGVEIPEKIIPAG